MPHSTAFHFNAAPPEPHDPGDLMDRLLETPIASMGPVIGSADNAAGLTVLLTAEASSVDSAQQQISDALAMTETGSWSVEHVPAVAPGLAA